MPELCNSQLETVLSDEMLKEIRSLARSKIQSRRRVITDCTNSPPGLHWTEGYYVDESFKRIEAPSGYIKRKTLVSTELVVLVGSQWLASREQTFGFRTADKLAYRIASLDNMVMATAEDKMHVLLKHEIEVNSLRHYADLASLMFPLHPEISEQKERIETVSAKIALINAAFR